MADTNTSSNTGGTGTVFDAAGSFLDGVNESLDQADAAKSGSDAAKAEHEKAAKAETSALDTYVKNVSKLQSALKQYKSTADQAKVTAKESEMERQVAHTVANGGAVSISDVLEMMEEEQVAKNKAKQESSKYAGAAIQYAGEAVFAGAGVLLDGIVTDGASDSAKGASGLVAIAGGTALGLVMGDSGARDFISDAVENYAQLKAGNELGEGVEEKTIDGLEDESAVANYAASVQNGEGTDPYLEQNGGQEGYYSGDGQEFYQAAGGQTDIAKDEDALSAPTGSINLDEITSKVLAGEADPGVTGTQEEPQPGGLLGSIAESDAVQAVIGAVTENLIPDGRTDAAQKVIDMAQSLDDAEAEGQAESGIAPPDFSQLG